MQEVLAVIKKNERIAENIQELAFETPEEISVRAGQFLNISVGDGSHLLRRPIAICKAEGKIITICFQLKGEGTRNLALLPVGTKVNVLLPLGNGFYAEENEKKIALVGGGVGIFPMISCIREFTANGKEVYSYIGFRNKNAVCMEEELKKSTSLTVVTDDGSYGEKMNSVQALLKGLEETTPDVIFACGPTPMLRALKTAVEGKNIPCYVSLEERMGCGIGACLVCVCNKTNGKRARVCKDGPVFNADEVEL